MTILCYIRESDVAAYYDQGWTVTRLSGLHGARRGAQMRTFLAAIDLPDSTNYREGS